MLSADRLARLCDLESGSIAGCPVTARRLSELRDAFADQRACDAILRSGDPVVYTVSTFTVDEGPGQLQCGLGILFPGRVGDEYYLTRGHFHARKEAAEIYFGLRGTGLMILQHEDGTGATADLVQNGLVYVPGHAAHRTVNPGSGTLAYLGIYPADAGHDYDAIHAENFRTVIVSRKGSPAPLPRSEYLRQLANSRMP
jgi:glucose-6-phosphate isomerase